MTRQVVALGAAPIRATRWLPLDSVDVDAAGVLGDRQYSPVTEALACLKAADVPQLMTWTGDRNRLPSSGGRGVPVTYWGRTVEATVHDGEIARELSELLGERTLLARAQRRPGFIWDCPVSLLTTTELAGLDGPVERYRCNVVLDDTADPVPLREGGRVEVGECVLELVRPIERCVVIDRHPVTGAKLNPMLRRLGPTVTLGWGCRVIQGGRIATGPS